MNEQFDNFHQIKNMSSENERINRILSLDINQFPEARKEMHFLGRDAARYALNILQEALRREYLDTGNLKNMVDFGAGSGEPTFVLDQICKITGGSVTALEVHEPGVEKIHKLLPNIQIVKGNGFEYLEKQNSSIDLITAFNFGPDEEASLFDKLAKVSARVLSPNGKLLIYSDIKTIEAVRQKIDSLEGICIIPEMNKGDTYKFIAETIFLNKDACKLFTRM